MKGEIYSVIIPAIKSYSIKQIIKMNLNMLICLVIIVIDVRSVLCVPDVFPA